MSWEIVYDREYECPCGKGTYRDITKMDDWNRTREEVTMNCPDCHGKYVQKFYQTSDGGENWRWELRDKTVKNPYEINQNNLFLYRTIKEKD